MIFFTLKPNQIPLYTLNKTKKYFFTEKYLYKEQKDWRIEQKTKRTIFNCSRYGD